MLGYVTLGTNDLEKGAAFYDKLLEPMGIGRMMGDENFIAWGKPGEGAGIGLTKPFDGEPATVGNGVMVALSAPDPATVDKVHAKAMELGAKDEGAPGERMQGFYGGYFRDLDGNKFVVFKMG